MITPKFSINQNEEIITIAIHAPYSNIKDAEVDVQDNEICFYASPYHLRLYLPHNLVGTEEVLIGSPHNDFLRNKAVYDTETGDYVLTILKAIKGQHFPNLDMVTQLLTPNERKKPLIEVINGENSEDNDSTDEEVSCKQEPVIEVASSCFPYGFAQTKKKIFADVGSEINLSVDVQDPDSKSMAVRRKERTETEMSNFDYQHYLYDYYTPESTDCVRNFTPDFSPDTELLEAEREELLKLPRKLCPLHEDMERDVGLGLVDLLLSYCYNHRINYGEECAEASWNIAKLSSTLSWLDTFENANDVVYAFMRRSLIYPLFRNWELSKQVMEDAANLIRAGKLQVLRCLLEMRSVFKMCSERYILNDLYLTQYCCWIQAVNNEKLLELAVNIEKVKLEKDLTDLNITHWEAISRQSDVALGSDSDDESECLDSDDSDSDKHDSSDSESTSGSESDNHNSNDSVVRTQDRQANESGIKICDNNDSEKDKRQTDESEEEQLNTLTLSRLANLRL